jgi:hypothetical protein
VSDRAIERILRETGVPNLVDALAEGLSPMDLQSLLLAVYQRRAETITPSQLLERYEQDRFVRPSAIAPQTLVNFDHLVWSTLPNAYAALDLSPVCPLGTNAAIATVSQNKVVTTIRNTGVVADITNVLALECASQRRQRLRADPKESSARAPLRLTSRGTWAGFWLSSLIPSLPSAWTVRRRT